MSNNIKIQHTTTYEALVSSLNFKWLNTVKIHDSRSHYGSAVPTEAGREKKDAQVLLKTLHKGLEQHFSIWVPWEALALMP